MNQILASNISQLMASLNLNALQDLGSDQATTNQLMAQALIMQKIAIAAQGVGIDWDAFEAWVEPGATATKIVQVDKGDIVVVEVVNNDADNAGIVFLDQSYGVRPSTNVGQEYPATTFGGTVLLFDFDEAGTPRLATIAAATYATGDDAAEALQTAMNAVVGVTNTYSVTYLGGRKFRIAATNGTPVAFSVLPVTGPSGANSIAASYGFTSDQTVSASPWQITGDNVVVDAVPADKRVSVGFPVFPGEQNSQIMVLESDLYGILESDNLLRVPLCVRRNRIVARNRRH